MIDCVAIIWGTIMGNEQTGEQAVREAYKWGFRGDLQNVTRTWRSDVKPCQWVYVYDEGICLACGDDRECKEKG